MKISLVATFPTSIVSKSILSMLSVKKGYFPIALILRTFVASSPSVSLTTADATIACASSGEKEMVISCFYLEPSNPIDMMIKSNDYLWRV